MKKNITLLLSILFSIGINFSFAQNKDVYWVHGLQGSPGQFSTISSYFTAQRYITPHLVGYVTDYGIQGSANYIRAYQIKNNVPNAIIIAHSMGGLNMRQYYKNYNSTTQPYGGIITLGTPHLGSRSANNIDNGELNTFINNAKTSLTEGVNQDPYFIAANYLIAPAFNIVGAFNMIGVSTFKDFMKLVIYSLVGLPSLSSTDATNQFFGSELTKNDLKVGSTKISELQQYNVNIPEIAIYGVEDYPAAIRNAHTTLNIQSSSPLGSFDDDNNIPSKINEIKSYLYTISDAYYALAIKNAFINPVKAAICADASTRWSHSAAYLNGPLQNGIDWIVGAVKTETRYHSSLIYTCGGGDGDKSTKYDPVFDPDDPDCWQTVYTPYTVLVATPSDGVVPQESAWSLPGVETARVRADGVNHAQLLNSNKMALIFKDIFNGAIKPNDNSNFFMITNRN